MTTLTLNAGLLDRVLASIEANPETCERRCTGGCVARAAIVLDDPAAFVHTSWETRSAGYIDTAGGFHPIVAHAARLLGLSDQQADLLFAPDNTLDDLRDIVATIKGDDELSDHDFYAREGFADGANEGPNL